jgi:hypothetical protein
MDLAFVLGCDQVPEADLTPGMCGGNLGVEFGILQHGRYSSATVQDRYLTQASSLSQAYYLPTVYGTNVPTYGPTVRSTATYRSSRVLGRYPGTPTLFGPR